VGLLAWVVVLAPMAALLPAAMLDRGPSGEIRPTAFPLALTALDPYVWECVANSLEMAAAVTVVSGLLGVWFAKGVIRTQFWGRRMLVALGAGLVAVPPAFAALGLRWVVGQGVTDRWPNLSSWVGWGIWFWVEAGLAIPLVALTAASALAKVEPSWGDAARLAGTGRGRAWRSLIWPTVRPEVARTLGLVFTLTLVEPGAPIVLGLRRTVGFQIVEAALDRNQLGRAAVLALGATIFAGLVRMTLRRW
jgi:ABC-type Fe3+ transport system permease subunit